MNQSLPHIVLLGRPNVGKSTLFNRLIRSNRAITHDRPGVTRDRMEGFVRKHVDTPFIVVDTGGLLGEAATGPDGLRGFEEAIRAQVTAALDAAAGIALVVDGKDGLLPLDRHIAGLARQTGRPLLCVVNKVDGEELADAALADFQCLGLPLLAVSAAHGYHIPELAQALATLSGETCETVSSDQAQPIRIALLGRPNAGKSSLVNALCGEERMIVSDIPGTTRDSVDVYARIGTEDYVFVDTAGVRRKTKIEDPVERFSVNASIKSTTKADVTIVAIDGSAGVCAQDKRVIDLLDRRKTPFVIAVTKSDLLPAAKREEVRKEYAAAFASCGHVPILMVSAHAQQGLTALLKKVALVRNECQIRIPTGQMNRALQEVVASHQPPIVRRARPRFFYVTQAETCPPTFVFFVSDATRVVESYTRYLERSLRKRFGILHAPMRMHMRSRRGTQ